MGNLNAFLKPVYRQKTIEIDLGDRFINPDTGEHEKVVMKSLTQERIQEIARASTHDVKVGGKVVQEMDAVENMSRCLVESIVFPDLRNRELCLDNGTEDPFKLPARLFMPGEFNMLAVAFAKLNGIKIGQDGELELPGEITKN